MPKHESPALAARAWRLLRLALLCPRKGSAIKRRLIADVRLALGHLKKSLCANHHHSYRLHYGERELSFENTPTIRFNKRFHRQRRPLFPCIDPPLVSFDNEDEEDDDDGISFIQSRDECDRDEREGGEEGIDVKAEEFISRFYEEMKLQRQGSWLSYNENRGMSS